MAKVKFSATDDFGFGSDLDLDFNDFNVNEQPVKDDRSPVVKYAAAIGRGVKDHASDPANYERVIRQAMPKGYGTAADMALQANRELKGLYNSVADELRPAVSTARQTVAKFLPKIEDKAPKFIVKGAKRFAAGAAAGYGPQRDYREDEMSRMMEVIFTANKQQQDNQNKIEDAKEQVAQATEQVRHRDTLSILDEIRKSTSAVAQYNNTINYNVQKKTLELGFRQYWVMADLLKEMRASNRIAQNQGKIIIKNTALPDYVKTTMNERFHETVRNRFLDQARDTMFAGTKDYIRRFGKNLRTNFDQKVKPGIQAADSAMQMAQMGADTDDFDNESTLEKIIRFAAGKGTGLLADAASDKLKPMLAKNRAARLTSAKAGYHAGRIGETINDRLNDPTRPWAGPLEMLREMLANAAPTKQGESNIETDKFGRLHRPTPFNGATAKSINEIIPGLLSHMHRELKMIRTGKEVKGLLTYDFTKNEFSDKDGTGGAIKSLFTGKTAERAQGNANQIISMIDRAGNLTEQQKALARKKIMERVVTGESVDVKNVIRASAWGGGDDGKAVADAFRKYLKPDENGDITGNVQSMNRQAKINESFGAISQSLADPRAMIQSLVNLGQRDVLVRSGIMTKDNRVDRMALARLLNGEDISGEGLPPEERVLGATSSMKAVHGHDARRAPVSGGAAQTDNTDNGKRLSLLEQLALQRNQAQERAPKAGNVDDCCFTAQKLDESVRLTSMDQTLIRIEELLKQSTNAKLDAMYQIYRRQADPQDGSEDEDGEGEGKEKKFSNLWQYATTRGAEAFRKGKAFGKRAWAPIQARLPGWMQAGKDKATNLGNRLSSVWGDIYISGETLPRINMAALKAGKYFDRSGKVLESLEDIKGDVLDAAGNVVATAEELKNSFVGGNINKRLVDVVRSVRELASRGLDLATTLVPAAVRQVVENARTVFKAIKDKLPPFDVYVAGDMKKPIMYASLMRYEKYFSRKTSKTIRHPRDIDGEVVDADGNIVVNEEQLKMGLVDINGVAINNVGGRMLAKVSNMVKAGAAGLAGIGTAALGAAGELMKKFSGFMGELFVPFKDILANSGKQVTALYEIYDLLNDRLPGPKKVRGDADGDGVRDGSAKDIRDKEEAAKKEKREEENAEANKEKGPSFMSKIMAGIGGLLKGKKDADDDDGDDGDTNIYGGSVDAGGDDKKKDKKGKKGKGKGKAGKAAKSAGKAAGKRGILGRTVGAVGRGAWGATKAVGNVAKAVLTPSTAIGGALMGGARLAGTAALGALSAGGAIAGGLATAGSVAATVAGALFTWPVAVAVGVGALGYMAYRYSQKTKLTTLSKIRVVQYGCLIDNQDEATKFFELEKLHYDALSMSNDGQIKIDPKKIDPKAVFELFEINTQRTYGLFEAWYKQRFTPIFRRHIQKLWQVKKGAELKDVESVIEPAKKLEYINTTIAGLEQAHNFDGGWNAAYPRSQTNDRDVRNAVSDVSATLMKEQNKLGGTKLEAKVNEEVASVANMSAEELAKRATEQQAGYVARDKAGNQLTDITATDLAAKIRKGEATVSVAVATPENLLHVESNRLDAMASIRFKAYGLTSMVYAKVRALGALEMYIEKQLMETPSGIKLNASKEEILKVAGSVFGVGNVNGEHGRNWIMWFNGRFLPIFMLYTSAIRKLTKKANNADAVKALPITKQLEVARAIVGCTGVGASGSSSPVWNNPTSPWMDGEPLNDDPNSVAGNMETIRVLADKIVLQEATTSQGRTANERQAEVDPTKPAFVYGGTKKRTANSSADGIDTSGKTGMGVQASGDMVAGAKGSGGTVGGPQGSGSPGTGSSAASVNGGKTEAGGGTPLSGIGSATKITGGNGSSYDKMDPGNADGWEALKKTINQAAAIVGIDPKTLTAMISIESGFRRNIKPIRGGKLMSSAEGLGQFLDGTWKQMMNKYGKQYGIPPGTPKSDARASALMTAAYIKDNLSQLKGTVNRPYTATDAYIMHFFGPGDGKRFLRAAANENASVVVPTPARQHPEYFFDKGRPRTVQEVYKILTDRLINTPKRFGVKDSDFAASEGIADDKAGASESQAGTAGGASAAGGSAGPSGPGMPGGDMAGPPSSAAGGAPGTPAAGTSASASEAGKGEGTKAGGTGDPRAPGNGVAPGKAPPSPNAGSTALRTTETKTEGPGSTSLRKTTESMTGQEEGRVKVNPAIEEERKAAEKKAQEQSAARAAESMDALKRERNVSFTPEARSTPSTVQTPEDSQRTNVANAGAGSDYIRPRAKVEEAPAVEQAEPKAVMPLRPTQTPEEKAIREQSEAKTSLASDDAKLMNALHTNGGYLLSLVGLVNDIKEHVLGSAANPARQGVTTGNKAKPDTARASPVPMNRDW